MTTPHEIAIISHIAAALLIIIAWYAGWRVSSVLKHLYWLGTCCWISILGIDLTRAMLWPQAWYARMLDCGGRPNGWILAAVGIAVGTLLLIEGLYIFAPRWVTKQALDKLPESVWAREMEAQLKERMEAQFKERMRRERIKSDLDH